MLEKLFLRNIALIDETEISFTRGLNILTGETGAGKSAIISALGLLLGERADTKIIRSGAESATIQGIFSPELLTQFDLPQDDALIIRREIYSSGKSQLFIQDRQTTLNFAKELGQHLFEIVSQHAHLNIRNPSEQLKNLDYFAQLDLTPFAENFADEKELEKRLALLQEQKSEAAHKLERLKWELNKLEEIDPKPGEEEELFEEYKGLNEKQELAEKLSPLNHLLNETLLPALSKQKLEESHEIQTHLKTAENELQEAAFLTSQTLSNLDFDAQRLTQLENRLATLNDAKKRFGDPLAYQNQVAQEISELENLDEEILNLTKILTTTKEKTDQLAADITEKRQIAATKLAQALTQLIQELNMPEAIVTIILEKSPRSATGDEKAHILLQANPGERAICINDGVSGGEISRLYFALATLINKKTSLLFDEIDANIGGETATLFGEKLHTLGRNAQVIAITHFPQVARFADHHLKILKKIIDNRTHTQIIPLSQEERQQELLRMLGGQAALLN
ncbi:MAG: DNA repair protein RecN [Candidatus Algichlamydia australiensis]|nr:DNA repair protein RecN [Chlamydiales bacterium]